MKHGTRTSAALLATAALLSACGGGTDAPTAAAAPAAAPAAAAPIGGALTADVVLDWAEVHFPTLFGNTVKPLSRSGPDSVGLNYAGTDYTVRAYAQGRYLGITTTGRIYGLGDFTAGQLQGFGGIDDFALQVLAEARAQAVSVQLTSPLAPGQTFRFALDGAAASVTRQGEPVALGTPLASGTGYVVNQTDGPRTCTLSANRSGMVGFRPVVVSADCGRPPGQSLLAGQWRAPVGASVTLQLNGGNDQVLTMPVLAGSSDVVNAAPFGFSTPLADGSAWAVTVKASSDGLLCAVYAGATGTMPAAAGAVKVGCERRDELASRDSTGNVRGNFFNSRDLAIGGANVPVGRTAYGYGEGRFVAFVSYLAGIGGSSGRHRQVFWRDRLTGETLMISASAAGVEGDGESFAPALSADGLTVAFESYASNLVAGDTNGARDVFVWSALNRDQGPQRASVGAGGLQANSESYEPTLSGDGRWLAFSSSASNLTGGVDSTSTVNVYLLDRAGGALSLVTANAKGQGVGGSAPALSEDGSRLAFYSFAADIVAGDANDLWDVFVLDVASGAKRRVSVTASGGDRNQGNESRSRVVWPAISGNGRYVAWSTTATNVAAGDTNGRQDVFVTDLDTGAVQWLSAAAGGAPGNGDSPVAQGERVSMSYDGRWIAYTTTSTNLGVQAGQVVLRNLVTGQTQAVGKSGGTSGWVGLSRDAAYVALGQSVALDPRYTGSGLFVELTGLGRPWWWID